MLPAVTYKTCSDAYADGVANIPRGDASYAAHLDRDGDGLGCDKPPASFVPKPAKTAAAKPKVTKAPAVASTSVGEASTLPVTGPATDAALAGGGFLALGLLTVLGVRMAQRRRERFVFRP